MKFSCVCVCVEILCRNDVERDIDIDIDIDNDIENAFLADQRCHIL